MADAQVSEACGGSPCGFKSHFLHQKEIAFVYWTKAVSFRNSFFAE